MTTDPKLTEADLDALESDAKDRCDRGILYVDGVVTYDLLELVRGYRAHRAASQPPASVREAAEAWWRERYITLDSQGMESIEDYRARESAAIDSLATLITEQRRLAAAEAVDQLDALIRRKLLPRWAVRVSERTRRRFDPRALP